MAQPSGELYGPIKQNYQLPTVKGTIYYVSPYGKKSVSGISLKQPTSIEAAIAKVVSGDAIILRGGVYRTGNLKLNQNIIMQAYQDEQPIIKGTFEAKSWENRVPNKYKGAMPSLWSTKWSRLFPASPDNWWRKEWAGRQTPLHKFNNDMVFINGRFLQSVGWLGGLNDDSFYIDYETETVYITTDPTDKLVEITAFNQGLIITPNKVNGKKADGKGPTIRGITFSQYAFHVIDIEGYYPEKKSKRSEHGKDVVGTTFENCTISYAGRVGAFILGDNLTMRHCEISDTSTEGLYVVASSDVLLEKNIFTRNNIENITGYYPAAVKIFNQTHHVIFNDNLVIDHPNSNGVWYDVGNEDGVFTNNWLENIGNLNTEFSGKSVWPSRNAFFFEISKGARVAGNVFVNNDHGILILNSSDVKVYNNTFVNSVVTFGRDTRGAQADHFGWHVTTGPAVEKRINHEFVNNMMVGDNNFERPLLFIWQKPVLCKQLNEPALSILDYNSYVKMNNNDSPVVWLGQKLGDNCESTFATTADLHKTKSEYATNSTSFINYGESLFKSAQLKNFQLLHSFAGTKSAVKLPSDIKQLINNNNDKPYIGAYAQ
ncbi:MAG: right-handed parallel beta-helix repeat-containing protein [Colwellia sp.]